MRNHLSTAIIATALALLVPNNGAEAVGTMASMINTVSQPASIVTLSQEAAANVSAFSSDNQQPSPAIAWVMAIGFLGFVVSRRLRGDWQCRFVHRALPRFCERLPILTQSRGTWWSHTVQTPFA